MMQVAVVAPTYETPSRESISKYHCHPLYIHRIWKYSKNQEIVTHQFQTVQACKALMKLIAQGSNNP